MSTKPPQQNRNYPLMTVVSIGLSHPASIVALIVFLLIGYFLVSLYQEGTMPEVVAAFLVLIPGAIWYGVAYATGSARIELAEKQLATARAQSSGRPGAPRAGGASAGAAAASAAYIGSVGAAQLDEDMPVFNVDGTPMLGDLDIKGNPYGLTSPDVNVDGTPMVGDIDINGNPYGVGNFDDPFS